MDLDLLKKLGPQIAKSSMSKHDKQVYWVACTLAFWGSFRMGELLEKTESELSVEAITWSDIKYLDNSTPFFTLENRGLRTASKIL